MHLDNSTGSIDIIAPFHVLRGDNWHAIDLYLALLDKTRDKSVVKLWSSRQAHAEYTNNYPIQTIRPFSGQIPVANRLMLCGPSIEIGNWYEHNPAKQIVLIYTQLESRFLFQMLNRLYRIKDRVTIHYSSQMLKDTTGLPGEVVPPAFNAQRFLSHLTTRDVVRHSRFRIGRVSRDVLHKHHFRDPAFYQRLANAGFSIEIMGGTCLLPWLSNTDNINLLSACSQPLLPDFLSSLDCFFYRTSASDRGGIDRVVLEAMACGVPVLVENHDIYTGLIDSGINGILFKNEEDAWSQLITLREDAVLRKQLHTNAKATVIGGFRPI